MRLIRLGIALAYVALIMVTAAGPLLGWSHPYAPLSMLPEPQPVTLSIVYGTEKEQWLREAADAFAASGARVNGAAIQIELQSMSSGVAKDALLNGQLRPVVWSPASQLWLELINGERQRRGLPALVNIAGPNSPVSLLRTPLVLVAWKERAAALGADQKPLWLQLEATMRQGWAASGHPEWGNAAWGHALPTSANSGLQALVLMAYAFHGKTAGLTVSDVEQPGFVEWLRSIESGATFVDSSAFLINDMLAFGPAKYSVVATYENLALEQLPVARSRGHQLVLLYPPATIWSNHPYAILDADWVTPAQHQAARLFEQFLLSRPQQERAVLAGFRPSVADIALDGAGSPFMGNADAGVQTNVPEQVETPSTEVISALLATWTRSVRR